MLCEELDNAARAKGISVRTLRDAKKELRDCGRLSSEKDPETRKDIFYLTDDIGNDFEGIGKSSGIPADCRPADEIDNENGAA